MTQFETCGTCGEWLDPDSAICRFCGDDNAAPSDLLVVDPTEIDQLQPWSKVKHEIIEKYAGAYTSILSTQSWVKRYVYIDAFAGAGVAFNQEADELVKAGAARALDVEPPFSEYHFIELNPRKAEILEALTQDRANATVHRADYRAVLPSLLNARCQWNDFSRGLCLLDPYGLSVDYTLLQTIAALRTVEIFFTFMIVAANRNVLWHDPSRVSPARAKLMTRVWGDESWRDAAYYQQEGLFDTMFTKASNERLMEAYRKRLEAAGFAYVPAPIAMKNSVNAAVYYLFFCSPKAVAGNIVESIFKRYRG